NSRHPRLSPPKTFATQELSPPKSCPPAARSGGFFILEVPMKALLAALLSLVRRRPAPGSERGRAPPTESLPPAPPPPPKSPPAPARESPRDIQARLIAQGLLDPPADGVLGPLSRWAMREPPPAPLAPGADLAGRIVRAMLARGHFVARHRDLLNIVYVEGMSPDGTLNDNAPNRFNDLRCLVRIVDGVPQLAGCWEATTEPSRRCSAALAAPQ